tara:strand:+ start:354 stop:539 length:186 start_codon:yes stop_codon:yes gene_type:complete
VILDWFIPEHIVEDSVEELMQNHERCRAIGRRALQHFVVGDEAANGWVRQAIAHDSKAIRI